MKIYKISKIKDKDLQKYQSFGWISIDVPSKISKQMRGFCKQIPEEELFKKKEGDWKYGIEDEHHVTVKWGIHTKDISEVKEVLSGQQSGNAELAKVSIFDNDEYDVLKVDVISKDLRRLNKVISEGLEVTDTHPDYKPHLTLAYLKKGNGKKYTGDTTFEGMTFSFDKVTFEDADDKKTVIDLEKKR